jgi:hypothetical protein
MAVTFGIAATEQANEIHCLVKSVFNELIAPGYSQEGIDTFLDYIKPERIVERNKNNHFTLVASG